MTPTKDQRGEGGEPTGGLFAAVVQMSKISSRETDHAGILPESSGSIVVSTNSCMYMYSFAPLIIDSADLETFRKNVPKYFLAICLLLST